MPVESRNDVGLTALERRIDPLAEGAVGLLDGGVVALGRQELGVDLGQGLRLGEVLGSEAEAHLVTAAVVLGSVVGLGVSVGVLPAGG